MADLNHDWRLLHLSNGLRLITLVRPGTLTVAVRAYVRAGSRYDQAEESGAHAAVPSLGLAHLAEHLLFQGTQFHGQRELFTQVERLGGSLEAGTTKEYVSLSAVVPRQSLVTAVDVLAEVLAAPALREHDFRREKLVVLEEIRRARDRQSVIFDLFADTLWQVHPLRYPILGTLESLRDL